MAAILRDTSNQGLLCEQVLATGVLEVHGYDVRRNLVLVTARYPVPWTRWFDASLLPSLARHCSDPTASATPFNLVPAWMPPPSDYQPPPVAVRVVGVGEASSTRSRDDASSPLSASAILNQPNANLALLSPMGARLRCVYVDYHLARTVGVAELLRWLGAHAAMECTWTPLTEIPTADAKRCATDGDDDQDERSAYLDELDLEEQRQQPARTAKSRSTKAPRGKRVKR